MPERRHFLGWDRPVLELAGEYLVSRAGDELLDLSEILVIVPTRNAGRRLREMLANLANERGMAMLAPQVVPTEFLLSLISTTDTGKLATPEECFLGWIQVLLKADLAKFRALFPVEPVTQDVGWARGTAKSLVELCRTLGESGLEIADIPKLVDEELFEEDRWLELAKLEVRFKELLNRNGLIDASTLRKRRVSQPDVPPGIREIYVVATPDPIPIALKVLHSLSEQIPTQVLVNAPVELASAFDNWGRPIAAVWNERILQIPSEEETIHVFPDSPAQAEAVADFAAAYEDPSQVVSIGILDEDVAPAIERRLESNGIETFNPQGRALRTQGIIHFFRILARLLKDRSYSAFMELLHCPDYLAYLSGKLMFWETPGAFKRFDDLDQEHLPQNLRDLRRFMRIGKTQVSVEMLSALTDTEALLKTLDRKPLENCFPGLLHDIFSARSPHPGSESEQILRTTWERLSPILDALASPLAKPLKLATGEKLELIVHFLEGEQIYGERPAGAVELLGWLELAWDDAPHLLLTGFNDGFVPESIVGDVYLPEQLRQILAKHTLFKTNKDRLARDAYLFEALLSSRANGGRVDILFGKRSRTGDPLRPSRLLFRCHDHELANRAQQLFREVEPNEPNLAWTPGFLLQPRSGPVEIDSIGVTAFRDYLASPLHFYWRHIEKMRAVDGDKLELDAGGFGTFCHEVLRRFGEDSSIRDSVDCRQIQAFFDDELDRLTRERFGGELTLPVRIQLQSARQRLLAAAEIQALDRQNGWKIKSVERNLDDQLQIDGVRIRGKVDRIDTNEKTGEFRVLDYKTTDRPEDPGNTHVSRITASTNLECLCDYARFNVAGKEYRWKDLQLPLYRKALSEELGPTIRCGYFNLPKAAGDTQIKMFQQLHEVQDLAAMTCAQGVIRDVLSGNFASFKLRGDLDEFAGMHLGIPRKTCDLSASEAAHQRPN